MPMKKQPEGVRRVARDGEKPPQSYSLFLGKGKDEVFLGWSERLPTGSWQAHPAKDDGGEIPPFRQHTALVEFLLSAHRGLEVHPGTQDVSSAEETAAILADPQTMEAIPPDGVEGDAPFQPEAAPEGAAPEAGPAEPDSVPFSHAAGPDEPWEYPVPEPGNIPPAVGPNPDLSDLWDHGPEEDMS